MIEVICNDRLGKKIRVKCNEDDTIGDLKKLLAAQIGELPLQPSPTCPQAPAAGPPPQPPSSGRLAAAPARPRADSGMR